MKAYIYRQFAALLATLLAAWARWRFRRLRVRVAARAKYRDRRVADATQYAAHVQAAAETQSQDNEATLRAERERFRHELAERDSKIKLLELELQGLVAINARYSQYIERDLAVYARQIEEARSGVRLPGA